MFGLPPASLLHAKQICYITARHRINPLHRQSEHDWAYAKRALARGDDPELIIQRIADYRSEDKADPNYYARHTVAKAQAQLISDRRNPDASAVSKSPPSGKEPDH